MSNRAIVLDANILIRAVLGKRVRELLLANAATVKFFAPDVAYADARKYLPALLEKRGVKSAAAMAIGCPVWTEDADFLVRAWRRGQPTVWSCIWWGDSDHPHTCRSSRTAACPKRTFNVEARGTDPPNRLTAENAWYLKGVTHR